MGRKSVVAMFFVFSVFSTLFFQNCNGFIGGQGTSTGNPSLHLSFSPYGNTAMGKFGKTTLVGPSDDLQNVSIIFCVSRLRFKTDANAQDGDATKVQQIPFAERQVAISPLGTDLDFISVPAGIYRLVEMDLSGAKCGGATVAVSNSYGTFSTNESIEIEFVGERHVDYMTQEVALRIQAIVEALATVQADNEIKAKMESAIGDIE